MDALIRISCIKLHTPSLVGYYFMSLNNYIICVIIPFCVTWEPFIGQKNNLFKDSDARFVIIYLIWVPFFCCDFNHLEFGLVQTFGSICLCLCHKNWRLAWLVGISFLSVKPLCNQYICVYVMQGGIASKLSFSKLYLSSIDISIE